MKKTLISLFVVFAFLVTFAGSCNLNTPVGESNPTAQAEPVVEVLLEKEAPEAEVAPPYYGFDPCSAERDGRGLTNERYSEAERRCDYEESEVSPTATLEPTAIPDSGATCISDDSVTDFPERELLVVNDTSVGLQVRDANCPRATYHDETGVAKGQQYRVDAPEGWSIAFAAVSCAVAEDGEDQVEYTDTPFIVIQGPWNGSLGCYEAGVHGLPSEWEDFLTEVILPIHESEVGHAVTPIIIGK